MDELLNRTQHKSQTLSASEKELMFRAILAADAAQPARRSSQWRGWWLALSGSGVALAGGLAIWLMTIQSPAYIITDAALVQRPDGQYLPVQPTQYALELGGGSAVGQVDFSTWSVDASTAALPKPTAELPVLKPLPLTDDELLAIAPLFSIDPATLHFGDLETGDGLVRYVTNAQPENGNVYYCSAMRGEQETCLYARSDGQFTYTQFATTAPNHGLNQLMDFYTAVTSLAVEEVIIRTVRGVERGFEVNLYPAISQTGDWAWNATFKDDEKLNFIAGTLPLRDQPTETIPLMTVQEALQRLETDFQSPVSDDEFFKQHFLYTTILNIRGYNQYHFIDQPPAKPHLEIKAIQLEYRRGQADNIALRTPYWPLLPVYRVIGIETATGMPFEALVNASLEETWQGYDLVAF